MFNNLNNLKVTLQKANTKVMKFKYEIAMEIAKLFAKREQQLKWKQSYEEVKSTTNDLAR